MHLYTRANNSAVRRMMWGALPLILVLVPTALARAQAPAAPPILAPCMAQPSPETDAWPVANTDALGTTTGAPIVFTGAMLLANDSGATTLTLTTPIDSAPSAGGRISGTDPFTYTPPPSFTGVDVFTYEISDASGRKAIGIARINVPGSGPALIVVPDVTGTTQSAATATLTAVGLNPTVTSANSTTIAIGAVISQSPAAGASVTAGTTVTLVASLGALVPNVVGGTAAAANVALASAGLTTGAVTQVNSATIPAGVVTSQNPAAGSNATPGSGVAVQVSLGPAVVVNAVPNVIGQTRAAARSAIGGAGLIVGAVTFANHATIAAGSIVSTSPVAGTVVAAGGTVAIVVSLGTDGLVVALGFDEPSGLVASDSSVVGNNGTIRAATHVPGKFGGALSFNGTNAWVTLTDTTNSPIDLTTGMTLEAWINPSSLVNWNTILMKERPAGLAYALYANDGSPNVDGFNLAAGYVHPGSGAIDQAARSVTAPPLNTWTHLAVTYDGTTEKLFVNGVQVSSLAVTGSMVVGNGALRVGGNNSFANEFYRGLIDEVRIYNRARTAAQITTDMNTPIVR